MSELIALLTLRPTPPRIGEGRVHEIADDFEPAPTAEQSAVPLFVCTACGKAKPADAYYTVARKNGSLRRVRQCKPCHLGKVRMNKDRKKEALQ